MTILGTPLGHEQFVRTRLVAVSAKYDQLMSQIIGIPDLQCAWILLLYCAAARPNYMLRVVHPTHTANFAAHHDASLRRALSQLLAAPPTHMFWDVACLPFSRGGMGLRSAVLTSGAAYWASWADSLHMIKQRHPAVPNQILHELAHHQEAGFHVVAASIAREELIRAGFRAPAWSQVAAGLRPDAPQVKDHQIGMPGDGWPHTHLVETSVRPRLSATEQAMLRSQGGPLSGVPFSCFPTSALSRFDPSQFRVLMLRRLWLPLPPSSRNCRCRRLLDVPWPPPRGFALESTAARICREAGARVGTNVMVRDMDLLPQNHLDTRRLEVVAEGAFYFGPLQLWPTLISTLAQFYFGPFYFGPV